MQTELDAPLQHGQKMAEAYLTQINILLSRDLDGHADSTAAYLTNSRISQAIAYKHAVPACPLAELAVDMGFSGLQHFSRVFGEKMGISPKRYFSICQVAL